jgi:glycosyltransferase involved in cell wall biosynthesis
MAGTIVYCSREDQIYPTFSACLARLAQQHPDAKLVQMISNDIADARNKAVLQAEGDWVWFIDTDMLFAPETLTRLLSHRVDVVQVLCLKRHPPHEPILWEHDPVVPNRTPIGAPRLVEVQCLGAGGTLYRRTVFESITGPWFEGILGTEDTNFATKIRAAGFTMYVDLTTPVGHTTPMVVWPAYVNGSWCVRYDAMNGQTLTIPMLEQPRIVRPSLVARG